MKNEKKRGLKYSREWKRFTSSNAGSAATTGVVTGNDVLKKRAAAYQKASTAYSGGSSGNDSTRVTGNDLLQSYSDEVKEYEKSYRSYENYLGKYTNYQNKYTDYYSRDAIQRRLDSTKKRLEDQEQRQKAQSTLSRYGQYMTSEQRQKLKKYASGGSSNALSTLRSMVKEDNEALAALDAEDENQRLLSLDLDDLQKQIDAKTAQRNQQWAEYQNSTAKGASFGGVTRETINQTLSDEINTLQSDYDKAYNLQWRRDMGNKYADLSSSADFASTSRYSEENDPQTMLTTLQQQEEQLVSQVPDSAESAAAINKQLDSVRQQIQTYKALVDQIGDTYHSLGSDDSNTADRFQYATGAEKATYYYLVNNDRYDEAEEYAKYLGYNLNERRQSANYQKNKEFAQDHPVLSSAASVPANLASGLGAIDSLAQGMRDDGLPIDFNTEWQDPYYFTNTVRGTISNDLDQLGTLSEDVPIIGGQGLGFLYQTGMSMVDSASIAALTVATGIPAIAGTALLGGSAATASMQDAHNKGLSDGQALATGVMAGVAETLFEEVSLDKLISEPSLVGGTFKTQLENWAIQTGKQSGVEGSEEFFTTAANLLSDFIINGNDSDILQTYHDYLNQGYSKSQAAAKTFGDELSSAMLDFLGGAISGGVMGGAKMGVATVANNVYNSDTSTGKRIISSGNVQKMVNLAEQLQIDSDAYQGVSEQSQQEAPKYNAQQVGKLTNSVQLAQQAGAIQDRLAELGVTGDTEELAAAVYQKANVRSMTAKQEQLLNSSEAAQQTASELGQAVRGNISDDNEWAVDAVSAQRSVQSYQYKSRSDIDSAFQDAIVQRNVERISRGANQATISASQTPVTITGIKRTGQNNNGLSVIVKDNNGTVSTIGLDELSRLPSSTSVLIREALHYGNDASVMFAAYTNGQSVGKYADAWYTGYEAGMAGRAMPTLRYTGYNTALQIAYETGKARAAQESKHQDVRKGRQKESSEQKQERYTRTKWRAEHVLPKEGTVSYDGGTLESGGVTYHLPAVNKAAMNRYQKEATSAVEMMVKAGVVKRVVFFASDVKNGQYEIFNGAYQNGTLYVDINAGKLNSADNRRMILQTFAHELTHSLEGTDAYKELEKFVLNHIGEEQLAEIKQRLMKTGMYSEEELQQEIVANACAEVLYDSTAIQAMAKENRTLYERVREFIRGLINKIRQVYQQENSFRQESILMRDVSEKLAELWDTALLEKLNSDAETQQNETQFEVRELDDGRKIAWIDEPLTNKQAEDFNFVSTRLASLVGQSADVLETGERVYIGKDIRHEYLRSKYTQGILNDRDIRRAKFKVAGNLQDVITVGTNKQTENATHHHASIKYDSVYRYKTLFAFPVRQSDGSALAVKAYSATMIVLHGSDGQLYLYDLVSINEQRDTMHALERAAKLENQPQAQDPSVGTNDTRNSENVNAEVSERLSEVSGDDEAAQRILLEQQGAQYSARVSDDETKTWLEGLGEQDLIHTYRSMQLIDGELYPPMAAVVAGSKEDASELGSWEMAVEHPELIKFDKKTGKAKFTLNKGEGQGSLDAAYNPYMHSSNLMLNDQFTGAYKRGNLVTVECVVPASENTSGYQAEYAKDNTGWHDWHAGPVASHLSEQRQVFLSRWLKPVRILSDAEVAQEYQRLLEGTDISVPYNVVSPSLLTELEKIGVPIDNKGSGKVPARQPEFSMREPVEQVGNLLALHNLTEQNLLDTIRLGGFPMPSIAVVKADAGHSKYGPISVVLPSDSIDPEADSRNHVYGGDAWTPTAPNVEYPVNSKALAAGGADAGPAGEKSGWRHFWQYQCAAFGRHRG